MNNKGLLKSLEKPVAIAMWDFSWLLAQGEDSGFEDIGKALDELVERGYNAVRLDVFPNSIYTYLKKGITHFTYKGTGEGNTIWGNTYDKVFNTPHKVIEIIRECQKRNIYISFSTWIRWAEEEDQSITLSEFKEMWDMTLNYFKENGCLENILFVDLLNEYPMWNGFNWLRTDALNLKRKESTGMEHLQVDDTSLKMDDEEAAVWKGISADILDCFIAKWPELDFTLSISANIYDYEITKYIEVSKLSTLDTHMWYGFWDDLLKFNALEAKTSKQAEKLNESVMQTWERNKDVFIPWMEQKLDSLAMLARENNITIGNTEGWALIGWLDTEGLSWDFTKLAAELCVSICKRYSEFKFICTSNFTHPLFKRLWADVEWHKKITSKIKG